ncbi:MAG: glycine cleavage system aminomethyltransferase GcvT [Desulfurococcales archaeon]|nr:glycine cleavage system aminomethyltransferase GcvT [Desulfurococcales archaeon]MEB3772590.1 glycine cleavage system aminomethyltransferase GcvT [Desulfurococcales archaeon]MEB3799456.1 glycine cleavage system aminomethyltransferase GcvT [Desulfurococcales archaeon]
MIKHPHRNLHISLGARMGEFGGWETPISYTSVKDEHMAVRKAVGVFDLTHMGRIIVKGEGASEFLSKMVPKNVDNANPGTMPGPTALLNESAGIIDDVMPYKIDENMWLLAVNAPNRTRDLEWLERWKEKLGFTGVSVEDYTFRYSLIALQGPEASKLLESIGGEELVDLKPLTFKTNVTIAGYETWIASRSGWTGEDGFEFILTPSNAEGLFRKLVESGAKPCGLGARDSLRMEIGFVLAGEDIDETVTPVDARYWLVFDYNKDDCVGCSALREALEKGARKVRVGIRFRKKDRRIPRAGYKIFVPGTNVEVGVVTSGSYSPILDRGIGQAYVDPPHALFGMKVEVEIRGKRAKAKIVDFPFIKK